MADSSFDVVSELNYQEVTNAINQALKEIIHRYDLKNSKSEIILNEKENKIDLNSADDYKIKAVLEKDSSVMQFFWLFQLEALSTVIHGVICGIFIEFAKGRIVKTSFNKKIATCIHYQGADADVD